MFTGLIQDVGTVARVEKRGRNLLLTVHTALDLKSVALGDSIAVDGYCQTVVSISGDTFSMEISPETQDRTTAGDLRPGHRVNVEPALRLSDRLGGHLVAGHVDGVGTISRIEPGDDFWIIGITAGPEVMRYCIEKGSITVQGISLTINKVTANGFELGIIPHTIKSTTLGDKKVGDRINLEADMIGKYVERFVTGTAGNPSENKEEKISFPFLEKHGFLK